MQKIIKTAKYRLLIIITAIILLTYLLSLSFFRIDLTSEKRYTLSKTTKRILKELENEVNINVYLTGELNIPFKKMERSIKELLDEFKVYAKNNLKYEFLNPMAESDPKKREDLFNELYNKGLKPSNILDKDKEGGTSEKIIFPGAIISYNDIELPVNLLKNNPGLSGDENINASIQALEYELISRIKSLASKSNEKIAFIEGHGELNDFQTGDITRELSVFFQVDRGKINGQQGILDPYKVIIIASPKLPFDEKDKYIIDQYVMNGGKVLWFIDAVSASIDSLNNGYTVALVNELNIDDLLFRYGVRINPVLVKDMQCNYIPVNMALAGNPANFVPSPWPYYPILSITKPHPVNTNINLVQARFANSIDTIQARTVDKTVLLQTSKYSNYVNVPILISLDEVKNKLNPDEYNSMGYPVAVLLEGEFESAFKNRMLNEYFPEGTPDFKEKSTVNKMLIVADGDMIRNDTRVTPGGTLISPLGYDKYTQQTFGNKEFIVNAINYMTDQDGLIYLRSKEFKLRLLDKTKIKGHITMWQVINVLLPVITVIIIGLFYNLYRVRKYGRA